MTQEYARPSGRAISASGALIAAMSWWRLHASITQKKRPLDPQNKEI